MFLTRRRIVEEVENGSINIEPFNPKNVGPNSVDVKLCNKLLVYDYSQEGCLDFKKENHTRELIIPEEGLILQPGTLYIGATQETATSHKFIPIFEGRSSVGRLGIYTHITAGFGDVGWGYTHDENGELQCHFPTWTLEIHVVHPVRVYPGVRIGQVYFVEPSGEVEFYTGKYSMQKDPQPSRSWKDFQS